MLASLEAVVILMMNRDESSKGDQFKPAEPIIGSSEGVDENTVNQAWYKYNSMLLVIHYHQFKFVKRRDYERKQKQLQQQQGQSGLGHDYGTVH